MSEIRYSPLWHLVTTRMLLFFREPGALFWVYGFPILMMVSLGVAFRDNPHESLTVDLVGINDNSELMSKLNGDKRLKLVDSTHQAWKKRLQYGKTDLVIEADQDAAPAGFRIWEEPRRTESRLARYAIEATLFAEQRTQQPSPEIKQLQSAGSRYIDFLLPGMLGMGLMGGGMWGVGFAVVDLRVRKLLKRFLATPMRRGDFLLSIVISRTTFALVDAFFLIGIGYLMFGVTMQGNWIELTIGVLMGAMGFAGIGLLVASRANSLETVSGLMNLIILPMWIFSGVFFSSERFPETMQPIINLLPLTALNQLLRGMMLEGQSIVVFWKQVLILTTYGTTTFLVALRIFRWK